MIVYRKYEYLYNFNTVYINFSRQGHQIELILVEINSLNVYGSAGSTTSHFNITVTITVVNHNMPDSDKYPPTHTLVLHTHWFTSSVIIPSTPAQISQAIFSTEFTFQLIILWYLPSVELRVRTDLIVSLSLV